MIRFIVFDLDGTLVDSRHDLADAANRLVDSYGGRHLSVAAIVGMVGEGVGPLVGRVLSASGVTADVDEAVDRFRAIYDQCLLVHTRPYPGTADALAALHGRWPLAVLTNKPEGAARAVLDGLDLSHWFDHVVGGDGEWPRKPAPGGLLHLARQAGVDPAETLLVGDSVIDRRTAREAGSVICLARYGFGFAAIPPGELDGREWMIESPAELPGRIERSVGNPRPDRFGNPVSLGQDDGNLRPDGSGDSVP